MLHSAIPATSPLLSDRFLLLLVRLSLRLQLLVPLHLHVVLRLHFLALLITIPPLPHSLLLDHLHAKRVFVHTVQRVLLFLSVNTRTQPHLLFAVNQIPVRVRLDHVETVRVQNLLSLVHLLHVATVDAEHDAYIALRP